MQPAHDRQMEHAPAYETLLVKACLGQQFLHLCNLCDWIIKRRGDNISLKASQSTAITNFGRKGRASTYTDTQTTAVRKISKSSFYLLWGKTALNLTGFYGQCHRETGRPEAVQLTCVIISISPLWSVNIMVYCIRCHCYKKQLLGEVILL